MTFDAKAMKLLQPGQHLTSTEHPGLRLAAVGNSRTWTYRYRHPVDDKIKQIKMGVWPLMSVHAAIVAWEQLKQLRDSGVDPSQAKIEKKEAKKIMAAKVKPYLVRDACDHYANLLTTTRAEKGSTEIKRMFEKMMGDFAALPVLDVTRSQCFELISKVSTTAPVQAQKLRAELGAAWDYAIDAGRIPDTTPNYWRIILKGKIKSKGKKISGVTIGTAKRVLSNAEVGELLKWVTNFTPLISDVLILYLWTACRGAEIVGMSAAEVAQEADGNWWWTIPKERTKNARHALATDLRVPLFGRGLEVVQRRLKIHTSGFLFPALGKENQPVQQKTIQATVFYHQPYCKTRPASKRPRLTVSMWAPHDLRRTSRTFLAALGCPAEVAESILGHMLPGIQGVYNQHSYDLERVEWLKQLSDYLESLAVSS